MLGQLVGVMVDHHLVKALQWNLKHSSVIFTYFCFLAQETPKY